MAAPPLSGKPIPTIDGDVGKVRSKMGGFDGDVDIQARQAEMRLHNSRMAASSVIEAFLTTKVRHPSG
jgi:hypothetical protein